MKTGRREFASQSAVDTESRLLQNIIISLRPFISVTILSITALKVNVLHLSSCPISFLSDIFTMIYHLHWVLYSCYILGILSTKEARCFVLKCLKHVETIGYRKLSVIKFYMCAYMNHIWNPLIDFAVTLNTANMRRVDIYPTLTPRQQTDLMRKQMPRPECVNLRFFVRTVQ